MLKLAPARLYEFDQTLADEGGIYGMDNRWVWNVGLDENIKRTLAWYLSGEIKSAHIGVGSWKERPHAIMNWTNFSIPNIENAGNER